LSLKESQDQRFQYFNKSERLQKVNEEIFKEMQEYKMQLVGVQEIKRDRDDRLDKLRAELEEVIQRHDQMDRELTALRVNHDHVSEEHKVLKLDYDAVSEKLRLSNKVRNEKEDLLNEKIKALHQLSENYLERDHTLEKTKKEVEKLTRRLDQVQLESDQLEIKKRSIEK
jgi:chromosome segregation ATPase